MRRPFEIESAPLIDGAELFANAILTIPEGSWVSLEQLATNSSRVNDRVARIVTRVLGPIEFRLDEDALHSVSLKSVLSHMDLSQLQTGTPDEPVRMDWGFDVRDFWQVDSMSNIKGAVEKDSSESNFGIAKTTKQIRILAPLHQQEIMTPVLPISIKISWADLSAENYTNPNLKIRIRATSNGRSKELSSGSRNNVDFEIEKYDTYQIVVLDPVSNRASSETIFSVKESEQQKAVPIADRNVYPPHESTIVTSGQVSVDFSSFLAKNELRSNRLFEVILRNADSKKVFKVMSADGQAHFQGIGWGRFQWTVRELPVGMRGTQDGIAENLGRSAKERLGVWKFSAVAASKKQTEVTKAFELIGRRVVEGAKSKPGAKEALVFD